MESQNTFRRIWNSWLAFSRNIPNIRRRYSFRSKLVVINRAESGRFAASYCGVVTQPAQFSFVRGGRIPTPNAGSSAWTRAKAVALIADQGLWPSEAGDALYFHASHVRPGWARARTTLATIDRHVFYR